MMQDLQRYSGEILGIAGIAGSGQKELLETIAGLQPMEGGTIRYYPPEGGEETLSGMSPAAIRETGHQAFPLFLGTVWEWAWWQPWA